MHTNNVHYYQEKNNKGSENIYKKQSLLISGREIKQDSWSLKEKTLELHHNKFANN